MTNDDVMRWLERTADVLHENRTYLTDLDSAIGDADHGINMDRGFSAVRDRFPTMATMDISTRLRTVGSTLVSTVGGAGGPLYGTAYLRAAGVAAGKQELDALTPALASARQALDEGATLAQITNRAAAAAEEGMKATIPMLATKGRASYLGERSIGHQDPGATSSWLILRSLAEACEGE